MLSDGTIRRKLEDGVLGIDPAPAEDALQPASVDLRLGDEFRLFPSPGGMVIDPRARQDWLTRDHRVVEGQPFVLNPGQFVLGTTVEAVTLDRSIAGRLEGKSSLGRLGLMVHSTAGFIDPGFAGKITLELSNVGSLPLKLWPGDKIGQLCLFEMDRPVRRPYGHPELHSRYQGQSGVTESRSYLG